VGKTPILQGFGQVFLLNRLAFSKIGNTAGDTQNAMVGAGGKMQALGSEAEKLGAALVEGTKTVQGLTLQLRVIAALALPLPGGGCTDTCPPVGAVLAPRRILQVFRRQYWHLDLQIDTVEEWAGKAAAILVDLCRRAAAGLQWVTQVTAGAGVHGGNQLKTRRKAGALSGARNMNLSGFQRFAQDLEHRAWKFWEFVEKEHSAMGETDFPGARLRAAPHQGGSRNTVMRAPIRSLPPTLWIKKPVQTIDGGDFEGFLMPQGWQ
jgi:hypothetical protein